MRSGTSVATQFDRHHNIFQGGERRDQLKRLKYKPDVRVPECGQGIFTQEVQGMTVQDHRAGRRTIQAGA